MKFEISKDRNLLYGTHYQNSINVSYKQLVKLFGEPLELEDDDKTRVEWIIKWEDEVVTCIYDWKSDYIAVEDVTDWHIGGVDGEAAKLLFKHIKLKRKELDGGAKV